MKIETWGYHASEEPRVFELDKGEGLPEGWHDAPVPRIETAQSGSADAEVVPSDEHRKAVERIAELVSDVAKRDEIIAKGMAENEQMLLEIEAAEAIATKATADAEKAASEAKAAQADLEAARKELADLKASAAKAPQNQKGGK